MNIGLIGCGNIGMKRTLSLGNNKLIIAADPDLAKAEKIASIAGIKNFSSDPFNVILHKDVELVIISTTNEHLANLTLNAVSHGKHVLVEKPAARNSNEINPIIQEAEKNNVFVKVGFNHRFHPAIIKAKEIIESGVIGELMFVRGRYGHGGRLGYEKEWRADPVKSGGGELIDQGVHLIDLSRWFLGELNVMHSFLPTYFWNMPVEDNAFLMLKSGTNKIAWLHASCTEWRNMFSFEIYGKQGKLIIDGLGGSYGPETLTYHQMTQKMGLPNTQIINYPEADLSWKHELDYFIHCIQHHIQPEGDISDAKKVLDIVKKIYI